MKNTKVKALADGAVCTAVTVLLLVIAVYVPPLALFSIAVAAAETAVAIDIIINIYRNIRNIEVKKLNELKD